MMGVLEDVSEVLWQERELLERLLFKIEEEKAIVDSGRTRWVDWCVEEIRGLVDRLAETEDLRARVWAELAQRYELPSDASLRDVINRTGYPWDSILTEHQRAMSGAAREIEARIQGEQRLADVGNVTERLGWLRPRTAA